MKRSKSGALFASAAISLACGRSELWDPLVFEAADGGSGADSGSSAAAGSGGSVSLPGSAGAMAGSAGASATAGSAGTAGAPAVEYPVLVTAGSLFSCGRGRNGGVKCWGASRFGSLGRGETKSQGNAPDELGTGYPDIDLGSGARVLGFDAGGDHVCARLVGTATKCWGKNQSGELGLGDSIDRGDDPGEMGSSLPFVSFSKGSRPDSNPIFLASGEHHTCAILSGSSSVKCWGQNHFGQLGLGSTEPFGNEPPDLTDLPSVDLGQRRRATFVDAGYAHSCAVLDDGSVKCWGHNDYGQLGLGDTRRRGDTPGELGDQLEPVALGSGRHALEVVAGGAHSCAILDDRSLKCWGANTFGQLGLGDDEHRGDSGNELEGLPSVELGEPVLHVVAGDFHTCALLESGLVKCWGYGLYGQLGQGSERSLGNEPGQLGPALAAVDLGTGQRVRELASGGYHVCAVLADETIKCWGSNSHGQLGLGDTEHRGDQPGEMGDALPPVDLTFR